MHEARIRKLQLRDLADRLMVEYAGALPPGQILATVVRAQLLMGRDHRPWSSERIALCERFARQQLGLRLSAPMRTKAG